MLALIVTISGKTDAVEDDAQFSRGKGKAALYKLSICGWTSTCMSFMIRLPYWIRGKAARAGSGKASRKYSSPWNWQTTGQ
jgi:hypothetical protein